MTWQPENGNAQTDPAPNSVTVFYRRHAIASANASARFSQSSASGTTNVSCDSVNQSANASVHGPKASQTDGPHETDDPAFVSEALTVSNGQASKSFTVSLSLNGAADSPQGNMATQSDAGGDSNGTLSVDFCLPGFDPGRFTNPGGGGNGGGNGGGGNGGGGGNLHQHGGPLNLGGRNQMQGYDPTFTRWLPLSFSPQVSSQPFRNQSGVLPAPWGNLDCAYAITLKQEPTPPNYDLDGVTQLYLPSPGSGGYNNPGPPYKTLPGSFTPFLALTDANGDRLLFDAALNPFGNIYSTLSAGPNGSYTLANAGPPGALRTKGHYTYSFAALTLTPVSDRLATITDDLGNQQALDWGINGSLLTVYDNSAHRRLIFNTGNNGYVGSVDAPPISGNTPNTHTTLAFDGGGHLTNVNVYAGGSNTLLHADTFGYGGPNGDGITSATQGMSVAAYTYVSDSLTPDPFGLSIPRLA